MTPLDRAKEIIDLRARATQGVWNERYVASAYSMHESNAEFTAHAANHAAAVAQAYIDAIKERDYWRTIAQEGVGGLPLEDESNKLAAIDAALEESR